MLRATWKSLLGRKVRLLMSTFAIVLGVAFVAGSLVFTDTLSRSFTALFASTVGDVVVSPEGKQISSESTQTIPASLVRRLSEVEGAARADGNILATSVFVIDERNKVLGAAGAPGLASNRNFAPAGHGLVVLAIVEGRAPDGADEVIFDAGTARRSGYSIGERVYLVTGEDEPVLRPTLVGIADFAEEGSLNGATWVAFDTRTSQELFLDGRDRFHDIWVTAEAGVSQDELRDRVVELLPEGLEAQTGDEAADEAASDLLRALNFLTTFLLIFAGIALVVGAFLIVNTFSILVAQRSRELALLRALGASKRQVSRSVLLEAGVLGLIGATVGIGLGVLMAMGIRALFANLGLDLSGQPLVFRPRTFVASYLIGVLVTMAAAWLPARRTSRIAPVQAMRDDVAMPESSLHHRFIFGLGLIALGAAALALGLFGGIDHAGWYVGAGVLAILLGVASASPVLSQPYLAAARALLAKGFGSVGNLAGQNSLRNPRRTTATASALMIGLALAGTMAIVGDSAKASVDQTIEKNFRGDYIVSGLGGVAFSTSVARDVAKVDGVTHVARQRFAFVELDGDPQGLTAASPEDLQGVLGMAVVEGSLEALTGDTVVVDESFAEENGLSVGDPVPLVLNGAKRPLTVVAVFEDNPMFGFPMVTSVDLLKDAGFPDRDSFLVVEVAERGYLVQAGIEQVVADLPTVTVKDQGAFAKEQRAPIDQMVLMIFALLGLAVLIAVLGIINTLALSVIERTREVGLLRAIGLSRAQLWRMITLESVVIASLGALLGVALGVCFGVALMFALRDQGLEVISVPWRQLAVFLLFAMAVGVIAAVLPARRAARLDVLKAIATE